MRSSITNGRRGSTSTLNRGGGKQQSSTSHVGSENSLNKGMNKSQSHTSHQDPANTLNRNKRTNWDIASESHSREIGSHSDLEGILTEELSGLTKPKFGDRYRSATTTALRGSDIMSTERRIDLAERIMDHESLSGEFKLPTVVSKGEMPLETESLLSALGVTNNDKPNLKHDMTYTKIFLQKQGLYNLSIWSHLTEVLNKIIAEQPPNVIDYFEEYSRKVKEERLNIHDSLRDIYVPAPHLESAKNQISLINTYGLKEDVEEPELGEEEGAIVLSNQMDLEESGFYMQQAGIAIPNTQLFIINLSIKKLTEEKNLQKPRFWGKIRGTQSDYFVFECELTDEEYGRRIEEEEQAEAEEAERIEAEKIAAEEAEKAAKEEKMAEEGINKAEEESKMDEEKLSKQSGDAAEEPIETTETDEQREKVNEEEETVPETRTSTKLSHEVTFDIPEQETVQDEEQEDPLLPPLPQPKKLLKYKIPPLLQPVTREEIKIPPEKYGSGLNKKVYYVSSNPELEWIELPKVTPQEISIARQIKVYMTGDPESKILSYPEFPGSERNYLRAQIARISAATQVSPLGYYKFGAGGGDDEEEEEEEVGEEGEETGGNKTNFVENPKYQPIPVKDMIDPSLASWVHHSQHILKQGRTDWWNPKKPAAGEEEGEEEQEEEEDEEGGDIGKGGVDRERGPALLSPLSEDTSIEDSPAWSVAKTHDYNSNWSGAVIRSNLWPGAHAFAFGKKTENVYCGWGHKHLPHGFSPVQLPHPEYEYELGPEIMEIQDPTVEVEQAWRVAHKKKPPAAEGEEGEEGEENEEEEEEEDEDDD